MKKKVTVAVLALILCVGAVTGICFGLSQNNNGVSEQENQPSVQADSVNANSIKEQDILWVSEISANWSLDPTDVDAVVNGQQSATTVIKGVVKSIGKADFLVEGSGVPVTPYTVEVKEVCSGKAVGDEITVCLNGGTVLVKDVIAGVPSTSSQKMGLDKLTDEEKNTKYISYAMSDGGASLDVGSEYVFVLNEQGGIYLAACNGYGIFEGNSQSAQNLGEYKNVVSGKAFDAQLSK